MAGYRHKKKRINLTFEPGHEYEGLEVTLRSLTLGEWLEISGIGEVDSAAVDAQLHRFAESLISWNLEDEDTGAPIPTTPEAVYAQDRDLILALATAWMDAIAGVADPLDPSSTDGQPSLEASLPMAPLSESLAS